MMMMMMMFMIPTSLYGLADEPGVEIFFKCFDLKQPYVTATQHVQRSRICRMKICKKITVNFFFFMPATRYRNRLLGKFNGLYFVCVGLKNIYIHILMFCFYHIMTCPYSLVQTAPNYHLLLFICT